MVFVFIGWLVLSLVVAGAAHQRGRSRLNWFFGSIFTSPIFAAVLLLLLPSYENNVDDRALQKSLNSVGASDSQFGWKIVRLALVCIVLAGIGILAAINNMPDASNLRPENVKSDLAGEHARILARSCDKYLDAYGTTNFRPFNVAVIEKVSALKDGLGSGVNVADFVATECRLNAHITIGQAVDNLLRQKREDKLPEIPIGGATGSPLEDAKREAFFKWVHRKGPRPAFQPPQFAETKTEPLFVEISLEIASVDPLKIIGATNLPDQTSMAVWLIWGDDERTPPPCVPNCAFGTYATVKDRRFVIGVDLTKGAVLRPRGWKLLLQVLPNAMGQPESVRSLLGQKGEFLRGPLVTELRAGKHQPARFPWNPPRDSEEYTAGLWVSYSKTLQITPDGNALILP